VCYCVGVGCYVEYGVDVVELEVLVVFIFGVELVFECVVGDDGMFGGGVY